MDTTTTTTNPSTHAAVGQHSVPVLIPGAASPTYFAATAPVTLDDRSILAANRDACLAAMAHVGAKLAVVEYAGEGDSGTGDEVIFYADEEQSHQVSFEALLGLDVGMLCASKRWEPGERFGRLVCLGVDVKRMMLEEALSALCDQAIDLFGHSGFENGNGGRGSMELSASVGLTLEHEDYSIESRSYWHGLESLHGTQSATLEAHTVASAA
jgi:hypothetical protein